MLKIQKFIRENGLDKAVEKWNFKVSEDGPLVQLNYHMIDTPTGVPECDECRGLILNRDDNWNVVAMPFFRFYNEQEGSAAKPNLETAVLQEKLDGSMIILYWHPIQKKWVVATRGSILAKGSVGNLNKTFSDLFYETVQNYCPNADFNSLDKRVNLMFELIGPENRILTLYDNKELRLIGARNIDTLEEFDEEQLHGIGKQLGVELPKTYSFNTFEDIVAIFDNFSPTEEGFVLVDYHQKKDGHYQRVKIKNPRYLALHHLLGAGDEDLLNNKRVVRLIRSGEIDEVIVHFPEYEPQIREMRNRFDVLANEMQNEFERIKHLGKDRRAYAEEAKKYKCPAVLFVLLDGKVKHAREYVYKMKDEKLLDLLNK